MSSSNTLTLRHPYDDSVSSALTSSSAVTSISIPPRKDRTDEMFPSFVSDIQWDTPSEASCSSTVEVHWDTYRDWNLSSFSLDSSSTTWNTHSPNTAWDTYSSDTTCDTQSDSSPRSTACSSFSLISPNTAGDPQPVLFSRRMPDCKSFLKGRRCFNHEKGLCRFTHDDKVLQAAIQRQEVSQKTTTITPVKKDDKVANEIDTQPDSDKQISTSGALIPLPANISGSSKKLKNNNGKEDESSNTRLDSNKQIPAFGALLPLQANVPRLSNEPKNKSGKENEPPTIAAAKPKKSKSKKRKNVTSEASTLGKYDTVDKASLVDADEGLPVVSLITDSKASPASIETQPKNKSSTESNFCTTVTATVKKPKRKTIRNVSSQAARLRDYTTIVKTSPDDVDQGLPVVDLATDLSVKNTPTSKNDSPAKRDLSWKKNPACAASRLKLHQKYEDEKELRPPIKFGTTYSKYLIIHKDKDSRPKPQAPLSFPLKASDWENDEKVQEFIWAKANLKPETVAKLMRTYLVKGRFSDGSRPLAIGKATGKGKFRRFAELPGEVRNLIWSYAIDALDVDCLVKQTCDYEMDGEQFGCRLKRMGDENPFLYICSESRSLAMTRHELTFGNKFHDEATRFNYERDRLFIVSHSPFELLDTVSNYFKVRDRRRVKFLMVPLRDFISDTTKTVSAITLFPRLEHVWFIVGDGKEEETYSLSPRMQGRLEFHVKEMHKCRFRNKVDRTKVPPVPKVTLEVIAAQVTHDLKIDGCQWV